MQNSNISFTSRIKPVNWADFYAATKHIAESNRVNYPWTVKEIVKAPEAMTMKVKDCSAGGIVTYDKLGRSKDVVMFHLCTSGVKGKKPEFVAESLLKTLSPLTLGEKRQGFLLGGVFKYASSRKLSIDLLKFMEKYKIPCSMFRGHKQGGGSSIAYNALKDEWLVTNGHFEDGNVNRAVLLKKLFTDIFEKVDVSEGDKLVWA